ncbi:hypothetical protein PV963_06915 [Streptomyces coeruleorubidus]|uniref:hypothetical protein n=1 Tax=Streptomyces coeruleorubidus TaxID=116188 RepID=UPI00237EF393|nr:hypothetical protein [Streptomyces coeruleorubidus]WDV50117.1 hypothetical protein PV963_06915 [Streptomyces coeruleorubidus]
MDAKNRFETRTTFALLRLEWLAALAVSLVLAVQHRELPTELPTELRRALTGTVARPTDWGWYVRLLRAATARVALESAE